VPEGATFLCCGSQAGFSPAAGGQPADEENADGARRATQAGRQRIGRPRQALPAVATRLGPRAGRRGPAQGPAREIRPQVKVRRHTQLARAPPQLLKALLTGPRQSGLARNPGHSSCWFPRPPTATADAGRDDSKTPTALVRDVDPSRLRQRVHWCSI